MFLLARTRLFGPVTYIVVLVESIRGRFDGERNCSSRAGHVDEKLLSPNAPATASLSPPLWLRTFIERACALNSGKGWKSPARKRAVWTFMITLIPGGMEILL